MILPLNMVIPPESPAGRKMKKHILKCTRMKRLSLLFVLLSGLMACENKEKEFPDFDYTAVYFPVQFPVRTLSLGNDRLDNSLDKELKFHIGVAIGGLYHNNQNWSVDYVLDENLCDSLGNEVLPMPAGYYSFSPMNTVIIPKGSFSGLIQVQLTEDFLFDTLAWGNHYVIPLRITGTSADSILSGFPASETPDKRIAADWDANAPPKDFTLFMVKYVNEYHGSFLRRGVDYTLDAVGNRVDTTIYRAKYVEKDQVVRLTTSGRRDVVTDFTGSKSGFGYAIKIIVDPATNNITAVSVPGTKFQLAEDGTGKFIPEGDTWGGILRDAIVLNYKYLDEATVSHEVFDTLVFRDRGIKYEEFTPLVLGLDE